MEPLEKRMDGSLPSENFNAGTSHHKGKNKPMESQVKFLSPPIISGAS